VRAVDPLGTDRRRHVDAGSFEPFHRYVVDGDVFEYAVANTAYLRERSFRFVYDQYKQSGLGGLHPSRMWFSISELLPDNTTILVIKDNRIVASISNLLDSPLALPADDVRADAVDTLRATGGRPTEVFSLAIHPELRPRRAAIGRMYSVISSMNYFLFDRTHLVICVVPDHMRFFREQLLFEWDGVLGFHAKTGVDCRLLTLPLINHLTADEDTRRRSMLAYFLPERELPPVLGGLKAQLAAVDRAQLEHFLAARPEILERTTSTQKTYLDDLSRQEQPCEAALNG